MLQDYQPVLRNRNFLLLWASQVLSLLTINIMNFVLLMRLFDKTGSSLATAFLWIAYALPAILFGPFAAAAVDVRDRKEILIVSNLVQSLTIFLFALSHRSTFYFLYGVVFIYSFLNQFYVPAESASLPSLVPKTFYTQANSLFFLTQHVSLLLGFSLGGVFFHLFGFERTLFLCASFVFVAFLCVLLLPRLKAGPETPHPEGEDRGTVFHRIRGGYSFIRKNRLVLAPLFLLLGLQTGLAVIIVNLPGVARDLLRIDVHLSGVYMIVPAAAGVLIGTVLLPKLTARAWRKKRIIETGLFCSALLILVVAFGIPLIRNSIRIYLGVLLNAFLGLFFIGITVPAQTLMQEATPVEMRGRVFGNFAFLGNIFAILPVLFSGTIAQFFGIKTLFAVIAALCAAVVVFSKTRGDRFLNPGGGTAGKER